MKIMGFEREYRQIAPYHVPKYLTIDYQCLRNRKIGSGRSLSDEGVCGNGQQEKETGAARTTMCERLRS